MQTEGEDTSPLVGDKDDAATRFRMMTSTARANWAISLGRWDIQHAVLLLFTRQEVFAGQHPLCTPTMHHDGASSLGFSSENKSHIKGAIVCTTIAGVISTEMGLDGQQQAMKAAFEGWLLNPEQPDFDLLSAICSKLTKSSELGGSGDGSKVFKTSEKRGCQKDQRYLHLRLS
jgi:hypothetical protein